MTNKNVNYYNVAPPAVADTTPTDENPMVYRFQWLILLLAFAIQLIMANDVIPEAPTLPSKPFTRGPRGSPRHGSPNGPLGDLPDGVVMNVFQNLRKDDKDALGQVKFRD
jgi:hypothetical protein